jgi:glutaminyl-tRNA synthetase
MTSNHDTVYPAANDVGRHAGASEAGRASNATDFIRQIVEDDLRSGAFGGRVHTRFPPEPNGYLHIGHAKAICLNFDLAAQYGGRCNLRFDDTNPAKENTEYIEAMLADIRWLGYDWGERVYYASDYFEQLYTLAEELIRRGRAYVCDLGPEEIRAYRGTLTRPGTDSPYRNRSVAENLALFRRMRAGEFAEGTRTLRAKIDMAAPNPVMRDPVLYRILKAPHHRTGTHWPIYPLYDFAHALSDAIEGITYSISTLEFENNHPLYHWILDQLGQPHPRRLIFARLSLTYTLTSKRRLRHLVEHGVVRGWDDPRLPTLSGLRRRGCPPGPFAPLSAPWVWPAPIAWWIRPCWSISCARNSIAVRRGAWLCCARSS